MFNSMFLSMNNDFQCQIWLIFLELKFLILIDPFLLMNKKFIIFNKFQYIKYLSQEEVGMYQ